MGQVLECGAGPWCPWGQMAGRQAGRQGHSCDESMACESVCAWNFGEREAEGSVLCTAFRNLVPKSFRPSLPFLTLKASLFSPTRGKLLRKSWGREAMAGHVDGVPSPRIHCGLIIGCTGSIASSLYSSVLVLSFGCCVSLSSLTSHLPPL